jgi:hypothetical protein
VVTDVAGRPDSRARVLMFPANRATWTAARLSSSPRWQTGRVQSDGSFEVGVPTGDFYLVPVPPSREHDARRPEMLDALARAATRVTLRENTRTVINLRTIGER